MNIISTNFEGLYILEPTVFEDNRGFFMESYNRKLLLNSGLDYSFVQDNQSKSSYGVIRGLHFQNPPNAQTKLVRVLQGKILDVVVDIRRSSATYGKAYSIELSSENKKQILVPKGFAHGFSTLSETTEILYKSDAYYDRASEGGLLYNDPAFGIDWGVETKKINLSDKDRLYLPFSEFTSHFD